MVLGIFALALALRLLYLTEIATVPFFLVPINDAWEYDRWAQEIAAGNWWGDEAFYQAPAYPYMLAMVYALAGEQSLWAVHVLQMVMGALSCVLLFVATRSLFGDGPALAAGILLALYPPAIYFDGIIGKIELGLFLFTGLLAILLHFQRHPSRWKCLGAGVVLGLLALTRENALVFVAALPLWMAVRFRDVPWRRRGAWLGAFFLGLVLVLGSVGLRNLAVGDSFVLTTAQMGTNFYIGNNPQATGLYEPLIPGRNTPTYEASDAANIAEQARGRELTRSEVSDYWLDRGLEFVFAEPGQFLGLFFFKVLNTWNHFEISDTEDIYVYADWSRILRWGLPVFHFGLLAPLAAAGLIFAWDRRRDFWLLCWLALAYTVAVALFLTFARFRFPLVPLLLPFAGLAVAEAVRALRLREWRLLVAPTVAFAIAFPLTNRLLLDEEAMRAVSYLNLAGIMLNERREQEAEPYLARAAMLQPENADLHFHYGVYYYRQGRFEEAEKSLREMIRLEENDVRGYRLLASTLRRLDRKEEAMRVHRRARELDPDSDARHPPKADRPRVAPLENRRPTPPPASDPSTSER